MYRDPIKSCRSPYIILPIPRIMFVDRGWPGWRLHLTGVCKKRDGTNYLLVETVVRFVTVDYCLVVGNSLDCLIVPPPRRWYVVRVSYYVNTFDVSVSDDYSVIAFVERLYQLVQCEDKTMGLMMSPWITPLVTLKNFDFYKNIFPFNVIFIFIFTVIYD